MPRYRGTSEGTPALIGRLLLLIAAGKETSSTLAAQLGVSPRQVNRYVLQLREAGWQIERRGVPTKADYWFELVSPQILLPGKKERSGTRKPR
jgi:biotin operon repressor